MQVEVSVLTACFLTVYLSIKYLPFLSLVLYIWSLKWLICSTQHVSFYKKLVFSVCQKSVLCETNPCFTADHSKMGKNSVLLLRLMFSVYCHRTQYSEGLEKAVKMLWYSCQMGRLWNWPAVNELSTTGFVLIGGRISATFSLHSSLNCQFLTVHFSFRSKFGMHRFCVMSPPTAGNLWATCSSVHYSKSKSES